MQKYTVTSQTQPRLDLFISEKLPQLSRSHIQKLSKLDKILVNNVPSKPSHRLKLKDKVTVDYDPSEHLNIIPISLPIIYQDDDVVVLDKPAGVLSHSKGNFNPEATVASFIQSLSSDLKGNRSGIVHRLDRATSGVMIGAKSESAQSFLQKEFTNHRVTKAYTAIVSGHLNDKKAVIDMPIERNPKKPATFRVGSNGKTALTQYEVLKSNKLYDLVLLTPKTGRTHQLRVHMSELGHPIVGDVLYGGEHEERLFLHSGLLKIRLPSNKNSSFKSNLPSAFNKFLRKSNG